MTGEQIVEAAKAETTLKITWLKLAIAGLAFLGIAFGGGKLGVQAEQGGTNAVLAKLADRVVKVEAIVDRRTEAHRPDGEYGRVLGGFDRMTTEFATGKAKHFALADDVKRNSEAISIARSDAAKILETMGELKSDVRHMMRVIEKKH